MPYGTMLKLGENSYLLAGYNGTIAVKDTKGDIVRELECILAYKTGDSREAHTSAAIYLITFNPREVTLPDNIQEVGKMIEPGETEGTLKLCLLRNVAGGSYGFLLTPDAALELEKTAVKPKIAPPGKTFD